MATNILPPHLVPREIDLKASLCVADCITKGVKKIHRSMRYEGVKFFSRSSTAGYVMPNKHNVVYLNLELYKRNPERFINEIIPHEVAHLFAHKLSPKDRAHGITRQKVMQKVFNLEPVRCHDMETTGIGRTTKKFLYICNCGKHTLGTARHNKIKKGVKYTCRTCKKELVLLRSL